MATYQRREFILTFFKISETLEDENKRSFSASFQSCTRGGNASDRTEELWQNCFEEALDRSFTPFFFITCWSSGLTYPIPAAELPCFCHQPRVPCPQS